jgi:hypothetical protein
MEATDWHIANYLREVINQAESAIVHADHYNAYIKEASERRNAECFAAIQGILTAAAQVHQLLWVNHGPNQPREYSHLSDEQWTSLRSFARSRSKKLRKILQAADSSPLKSRAVRNSFEHFDARLDERLAFGSQIVVDRILSDSTNAVYVKGMEESQYLRRIDPASNEVSVLDQTVSFQALYTELVRMAGAASEYLSARSSD